VFATAILFHPSLIFEGETRGLPLKRNSVGALVTISQYARVFANTAIYLHPILIFVGKAGADQSGATNGTPF